MYVYIYREREIERERERERESEERERERERGGGSFCIRQRISHTESFIGKNVPYTGICQYYIS